MTAGQRLGRYELVARLGQGAAGEVWEAVLHGPQGFAKPVALKLVRPGSDRTAGDAFVQEARLGALLQHPNVVSTLDLCWFDDRVGIAMELVRGAPLSSLCRSGPMPPAALIDLAVQAAAGLAHIHALRIDARNAGLVHRDIKPPNLLLDRTGLLKVVDLGIARIAGAPDAIAGTPGYMSPEQVTGTATAASDLFSLGATLFQLATGTKPFGSGPGAVMQVGRIEHLLRGAGFLKPVDEALPGLGEVVRRCLRYDPQERFSSAEALGVALAALRSSCPVGPTALELLANLRPDLDVEAHSTARVSVSSDVETVVRTRGNLPDVRDRFFGRSTELAELLGHLTLGQRLVTLLGPGGMGKTRLALEAARGCLAWAGGAWFMDLSEQRTAESVCRAVAQGFGIVLDRGDPVEQVGHALRAKGKALLVLDNLEQVVGPAATVVARWLELAPDATVLGTSRIPLRVRAERRFPVGALSEGDGVALFVDRLARVLDEGERADVVALVLGLEGMPLAIELAAARGRMLPVPEIRRRLHQRLKLLSGGERDRPDRHQSLRASLDGTYELLSEPARVAIAQLAVFEGGWTVEAAEAVLDLSEWPDLWALDVLTELVEASLVRLDTERGRFSALLVVIEWAAERLGAARQRFEVRHGRFFAQLGSPEVMELLHVRSGQERLIRLLRERDNLVGATRRAIQRGDIEVMVPVLRAATYVAAIRGPTGSELPWLEAALELPVSDLDRLRLRALVGEAKSRLGRNQEAADELGALRSAALEAGALVDAIRIGNAYSVSLAVLGRSDEAIVIARENSETSERIGERRAYAISRYRLATSLLTRGFVEEAETIAQEARALFEAMGSTFDRARSEILLGSVRLDQGELEGARAYFLRAHHLLSALDAHKECGNVLVNVGITFAQAGRIPDARSCYEQALSRFRSIGDRSGEGLALANVGGLLRDQGLPIEAEDRLRAAIEILREVGDQRLLGVALNNLAIVFADTHRNDEVVPASLEALAVHRAAGNRRSEGVVMTNLGNHYVRMGSRDQGMRMMRESLDVHREVRNLRFEAIALQNLGAYSRSDGDFEAARRWLDEALALDRRTGNRRSEVQVLDELGSLAMDGGRLEEAQGLYEHALSIAIDVEDLRSQAALIGVLGTVAYRLGRYAVAAEQCAKAIVQAKATEHGTALVRAYGLQAALQAREGHADLAEQSLRSGEGTANAMRAPGADLLGLFNRVQVAVLLERRDVIAELVAKGAELLARCGLGPTSSAARELDRIVDAAKSPAVSTDPR